MSIDDNPCIRPHAIALLTNTVTATKGNTMTSNTARRRAEDKIDTCNAPQVVKWTAANAYVFSPFVAHYSHRMEWRVHALCGRFGPLRLLDK